MIKIKRYNKKPSSKKKKAPKKSATKSAKSVSFVTVLLKRHRDSQGNHNHVILEDIDDRHVSVGTTSRPKKGKNSPNYKCENVDIVEAYITKEKESNEEKIEELECRLSTFELKVFKLKYKEELKANEIAKILGVNINKIYSACDRIKSKATKSKI